MSPEKMIENSLNDESSTKLEQPHQWKMEQHLPKNREKENILNDYLCSIFTQEDLSYFQKFDDVTDINVNIEGIQKVLANLDHKKASSPDEIPILFLQLVSEELAPVLTKMFQLYLNTYTISQNWRHTFVQPIFKKGDRKKCYQLKTNVCSKLINYPLNTKMGIGNANPAKPSCFYCP